MHIVYGLHAGDGVIRYVGQTSVGLTRRLTTHRCNARGNAHLPVQFWMLKHGLENIEIVELERGDDKDHLNALEQFWIAQMRELRPMLNVTAGGDGAGGTKHTEQSKTKISAANKGRVRTTEHRANISKGMRGKPRTEKQIAHLAKMNAARLAKKV